MDSIVLDVFNKDQTTIYLGWVISSLRELNFMVHMGSILYSSGSINLGI